MGCKLLSFYHTKLKVAKKAYIILNPRLFMMRDNFIKMASLSGSPAGISTPTLLLIHPDPDCNYLQTSQTLYVSVIIRRARNTSSKNSSIINAGFLVKNIFLIV